MFSIGPQYYSHIYIWLVAVLSIVVFSQYATYPKSRLNSGQQSSGVGAFFLMLFLVLFIGLRPLSGKYFVDMGGYRDVWFALGDPNYQITWDTTNKIFDNLFYTLAGSGVDIYVFFVLMAAIYFGCMAWACSSLFSKDKMAAFLVYLGAFSTFSYGTNGMKAGAAASLFLVALALYEKRRWLLTLIFILLSWGFHHSMVLPIVGFVVCMFVKKPKWFFAFWVFCFFMALLHITLFQHLFGGFADEHGAGYLLGEGENVRHDILGGFRIDFILYSAAPILIGWIAVYKKRIVSQSYFFLLNLYVLINAIWLLCMYAEFTNRISYLSWLLLPIVLIYPFLNEDWGHNQYKTFQYVALGHLAFTLFMNYIYY